MRGRWVFDREQQCLVPADEYYARKAEGVQTSDLPFPTVISDQIELKSMVDGKIYTSKAALRKSYRERGYVEVGNEYLKNPPKARPTFKPDRKGVRNSIGKAFQKVGITVEARQSPE